MLQLDYFTKFIRNIFKLHCHGNVFLKLLIKELNFYLSTCNDISSAPNQQPTFTHYLKWITSRANSTKIEPSPSLTTKVMNTENVLNPTSFNNVKAATTEQLSTNILAIADTGSDHVLLREDSASVLQNVIPFTKFAVQTANGSLMHSIGRGTLTVPTSSQPLSFPSYIFPNNTLSKKNSVSQISL